MTLSIVVAVSENNVIGKNNRLLWHLPNDLKFFKNTTWAMPVIMGRKTFESMGRALTGRTNIVITRQENWQAPDAIVVKSLEDALLAAADVDAKEAYVIGGGEIYRQAMPLVHRIYLTRVHATFDGDIYFEPPDPEKWNRISRLDFMADEKHAYPYSFEVWERKAS